MSLFIFVNIATRNFELMWLSFVACIFLLDSNSIVGVCSGGGGLLVMEFWFGGISQCGRRETVYLVWGHLTSSGCTCLL